jgi:outer membrane receptor protein involved in Fe transport
MKSRWLSTLMVLLLAVVGLTANVAYSQTTGDIAGTVTDTNGAPLPGASVTLSSTALQGPRTTVTDAAGRYRFPALPVGTYSVTAALSGFTKVQKNNQVVTLGGTVTLPFQLGVSVKEEVVVTGEAPVVDTSHSTLGTTTSQDTISKLPLARNFTAIASTVAGTGTSIGGGISVYGATGLENQYIIDGVNTTGIKIGNQGKSLNQEFVQEVEVKTGGYEAEYSRALGGIINVVTKSGGNEFHGDVFGYYDASGLAASDKNASQKTTEGLAPLVLPTRKEFGADLGGYFMKDRIWFFGAYDRVNSDQDINQRISYSWATKLATTQGGTAENRDNIFSGKLTFRLGESNTVQVSAFGDPGTYNGQLSDIIAPIATQNGTIDTGATDYTAKWDGIFGTQFLAQLQYGHHEEKNNTNPNSTNLSVRSARSGYLTFYNAGSGYPFWTDETYKRDAGTLALTGFFGSHEVKFGVNYEDMSSKFQEQYGGGALVQDRYGSGSGNYAYSYNRYFAKVPLNCTSAYGPGGTIITGNFGTPGPGNTTVNSVQNCLGYTPFDSLTNNPKTTNIGFFLQDSWKITRSLTLNAGIRYDDQKLKDAEGNTVIHISGEWSPRVGIVWDFTNNGKSKLYANYGRYYTTIPQDIQTRALGNEYTTFAYNYTKGVRNPVTDPSGFGYAYIQGGELTDPNLKGMYSDEVVGGVEYEIFKSWSVGVKGIYKSLGRVVEDRCDLTDPRVNLANYIPPGALTTCALTNLDGSSPLTSLKDPNDPKCWSGGSINSGTLTGNCGATLPRRYYRGVELDLQHRFSNNFYVLASYVYSKLEGNYDGNEKQSTGQADPNINADFDYVDLLPNNYGRLYLDRTHQFKLSGMYSFPFGLSAGGNLHLASGAPEIVSGYARAGYFSERYLSANRGFLDTMPTVWEADIHLEYALRIGQIAITPMVDVFNLFNRQGVTYINTNFNATNTAGNNPANQIGNPANPNCTAATATYASSACATVSNYLKPTVWQNPTQARIGVRVSF